MTKRCIISALLRAILLRGHGVVRCDQEFISSAVYLAFMFAAFPCPDLDLELRQGLLPDPNPFCGKKHRGEVRRDGEEVCGLIGATDLPSPLGPICSCCPNYTFGVGSNKTKQHSRPGLKL